MLRWRCHCVSAAVLSTPDVEAGDLTFMVGGHPRATDAVTPLLKLMGKNAIYCGKHGAGKTTEQHPGVRFVLWYPRHTRLTSPWRAAKASSTRM